MLSVTSRHYLLVGRESDLRRVVDLPLTLVPGSSAFVSRTSTSLLTRRAVDSRHAAATSTSRRGGDRCLYVVGGGGCGGGRPGLLGVSWVPVWYGDVDDRPTYS